MLKYTDQLQYVGSKSLEYNVGVGTHSNGSGGCYSFRGQWNKNSLWKFVSIHILNKEAVIL